MADLSRSELAYVKESLWGSTPDSAPTKLRFTGEFGYTIATTSLSEVRADRQVLDLIQTGASASGAINLELSYGAYDTLDRKRPVLHLANTAGHLCHGRYRSGRRRQCFHKHQH